MAFVLGLDVGSSVAKAALFDEDFNERAVASVALALDRSTPDGSRSIPSGLACRRPGGPHHHRPCRYRSVGDHGRRRLGGDGRRLPAGRRRTGAAPGHQLGGRTGPDPHRRYRRARTGRAPAHVPVLGLRASAGLHPAGPGRPRPERTGGGGARPPCRVPQGLCPRPADRRCRGGPVRGRGRAPAAPPCGDAAPR